MMRDEDIGRVLDEWFVEGPTQMPGRFFTATCDRIDRVPDRRFAPGLPRLSPASRKRGLAAAAAVLVVTVGVAGAFVTQNAGIGLAPSRTPAGSVAPFASSEPSARSLQGAWVPSGVRPPGTNAPYGIAIGPSDIELHEVEGRFLSSWSIVPPNRLELVLQSTTPGMDCPPGDHASYAFRVAADGVLTLDPLGDTCLLRTANLTGDWVRFSAPVVPLASALQSSWTSDVLRPVPGGCCPARYDIVIGPSTIRIPGSKADLLSSASAADPDVIDLKVAPSEGAAIPEAQRSPTDWQCPVGSAGTYAFALSQDGSTLELTPTSDACAPRAAVLAGGWIRTDMGASCAWPT